MSYKSALRENARSSTVGSSLAIAVCLFPPAQVSCGDGGSAVRQTRDARMAFFVFANEFFFRSISHFVTTIPTERPSPQLSVCIKPHLR